MVDCAQRAQKQCSVNQFKKPKKKKKKKEKRKIIFYIFFCFLEGSKHYRIGVADSERVFHTHCFVCSERDCKVTTIQKKKKKIKTFQTQHSLSSHWIATRSKKKTALCFACVILVFVSVLDVPHVHCQFSRLNSRVPWIRAGTPRALPVSFAAKLSRLNMSAMRLSCPIATPVATLLRSIVSSNSSSSSTRRRPMSRPIRRPRLPSRSSCLLRPAVGLLDGTPLSPTSSTASSSSSPTASLKLRKRVPKSNSPPLASSDNLRKSDNARRPTTPAAESDSTKSSPTKEGAAAAARRRL
jgi:hypothetical protein